MKKSELIFTAILVPLDFLMLVGSGLAAYFLRTNTWITQYRPVYFELSLPFREYLSLVIGVTIFLLVVFALIGLYKIKAHRVLLDDFLKILVGISAGIFVLVFYIFLRQELFNSRFLILVGWFLAIIFVAFGRLLIGYWQRYLMKKYHLGVHRVLIIGKDKVTQKVIKNINQDARLGYLLVGNFSEPNLNKIEQKFKDSCFDEIILADPNWPKKDILELVNFCENNHLVFKFVPNLFQTLTVNSVSSTLGTVLLIEIKRTALDGWGRIIKRTFDIIFSLLFIIVFSPVYLIIALVIKLSSPGPVIYKDYRYGYRRKKFVFYKFRSMRSDLCDGEFGTKEGRDILKELEKDQDRNIRGGSPIHKIRNDPRITKIGSFLRKSSFDELPQFFNVLKGDMSLVGYRPHMSYEVEKYNLEQQKMFCAKPGITGLAQISGRSDLDFDEEVKLDLFYIENWSLILDLVILLKTPFIVLLKKYQT
ncbi:sugar transferase [Patescibacteria group bacterium]|nr:sugar transferase [Patescibacteria group bacterium]MBU1563745.1 sugar transferase [Patescibacteria group bacterium]MBU2068406.1 sugar transferase [Patescibacteria group bacterium]